MLDQIKIRKKKNIKKRERDLTKKQE